MATKHQQTLEFHLATKAAWLNNVERLSLSEIADRLNLSTVKIHRLVAAAEKTGLLKTWVNAYPEDCVDKALEIKSRFSLLNCSVVPDKELSDEQSISIAGYAGAQRLYEWLQHQHSGTHSATIGVGKGRTIRAMVNTLPKIERPDIDFVAISGSMQRNHAIMKEDVIHSLTAKTAGKGFLLPHPYFANSSHRKKAFLSQKIIRELHAKAISADKIIVGVGNIKGNPIFNEYHLVNDPLWEQVIKQGAVADFLGTMIDIDGKPVKAANNLSLGLQIEDLRNQGQTVMAVVGGKNKGPAALSALRTRVITDLIIGETSAEKVLRS